MITTVALAALSDDDIRQADTIRAVDPARPGFFQLISSPTMRARRREGGRQAGERHQLDVRIDSAGGGMEGLRARVAQVYPDAAIADGGPSGSP
jgi:hypothetical protein